MTQGSLPPCPDSWEPHGAQLAVALIPPILMADRVGCKWARSG